MGIFHWKFKQESAPGGMACACLRSEYTLTLTVGTFDI